MEQTVKILGLDAGTRSFGYSILEARQQDSNRLGYRLVECGMIPCPVASIDGVYEQVEIFTYWIKSTVKKHKVDRVIGVPE